MFLQFILLLKVIQLQILLYDDEYALLFNNYFAGNIFTVPIKMTTLSNASSKECVELLFSFFSKTKTAHFFA